MPAKKAKSTTKRASSATKTTRHKAPVKKVSKVAAKRKSSSALRSKAGKSKLLKKVLPKKVHHRLFFGTSLLLVAVAVVSAFILNTKSDVEAVTVVKSVQAESFTWTPIGNVAVQSDYSASGSKAVRLSANASGYASTTLTGAAEELRITAKAGSCFGDPTMQVKLDGKVVGTGTVNSGSWKQYSIPAKITAGTHRIDIAFTNQNTVTWFWLFKVCSRSLSVDKVDMSVVIPNPSTSPSPSPSSSQSPSPSSSPTTSTTPKPSTSPSTQPSTTPSSSAFVTRTSNGQLSLGGQRFRFSGPNIYWLGLSESAGINYPPKSQIDSVLSDVQAMGGNVVRTFGVNSVGCSLCIQPKLGVFNDGTNGKPNAFQSMDYAISVAKAKKIRLVMSLVDNYNYYHGGKNTYLNWRGKSTSNQGSQFFTDSTVISDFEKHITAVLNHVNPYTGLAYKNDPTILAWETGNELSVYPATWTFASWTDRISKHIKLTLGAKQLVMDGRYGIYSKDSTVDTASLSLPYVDIETTHSYDNYRTPANVASQAAVSHSYGKAFVLGEYTWTGKGTGGSGLSWTLAQMLTSMQQNNVDGDSYWSMFPNGVNHGDGFTLHWPGDNADMKTRATQLKNHAYVMCPSGAKCRS